MRKAFTITELLVAMGLLAVVLVVSGTIFSYSFDAQRRAAATAEVMRTVRAVVDQLNTDFAGLYENSPVVVRFEKTADGRADGIAFFSVGEFETVNTSIHGNIARIYYGQSNPASDLIIARKQVVLGASVSDNESDTATLLDEQKLFNINSEVMAGDWVDTRPAVDYTNLNQYPMYFAGDVNDFTIQIEDGRDVSGAIKWWPKDDTEVPNDKVWWWPKKMSVVGPNAAATAGLVNPNFIDVIKFSFTVYDSQGVFENGRRFEHIVYIKR